MTRVFGWLLTLFLIGVAAPASADITGFLGTNATPLDRPGGSTHPPAYLEINPVMSGKVRVAATGFDLVLHDREHPPSERCLLGVYDPIELLDEALVRHIAEQFLRLALASHWSANDRPMR